MKIGVVDSRARTRTFKEMIALKNKADIVFLRTTKNAQNAMYIKDIKTIDVRRPKDIIKVCRAEKIDLLHTHNYPDTYGEWAMKVRDRIGVPFVHEVHDIAYENASIANRKLEKKVLRSADSLIVVGRNMKKYIKKKHGVGSTIIYAYPNKEFLPRATSWGGDCKRGVYQGGIRKSQVKNSKFNHRYYGDIFKKLTNQGLTIDVYPAYRMSRGLYPYVKVRKHVTDMKMLYRNISRYDFAFVGYNSTPSLVMDMGCPNKLYEAIGCGVPVVCSNYDEIGRFVRDNGFGVVLDKRTLKLPKKFVAKMRLAKNRVLKRRREFVMENQADKLMNIYRSVL